MLACMCASMRLDMRAQEHRHAGRQICAHRSTKVQAQAHKHRRKGVQRCGVLGDCACACVRMVERVRVYEMASPWARRERGGVAVGTQCGAPAWIARLKSCDARSRDTRRYAAALMPVKAARTSTDSPLPIYLTTYLSISPANTTPYAPALTARPPPRSAGKHIHAQISARAHEERWDGKGRRPFTLEAVRDGSRRQ